MELNEILSEIDELMKEVEALRPLSKEQQDRLMQKLRFDWNYHSNNIEGNTLTYGETKSLLLWGTTAQGKPLRDHLEVKGHNQAVEYIMDVIKGEKIDITEHFIRGLHELILPKEYFMDAITKDGTRTERKITPGKYKSKPNHVKTQTGEMFYFASPEDTPAKMQELIEWYRNEISSNKNHPLLIAAMFHYKFVRIHPFDDGNGRMSRLLMNLILMKYDFPPAIIDTKLKNDYLNALQYADKDDFEKFIAFVGERLIESIKLWLKAAKGESLDDIDDIDKMVATLKKKMEYYDDYEKLTFDSFKKTFDYSIKHFLKTYFSILSKFDDFFKNIVVEIKIDDYHKRLNPTEDEENIKNTNDDYLYDIIDKCYDIIDNKEIFKHIEMNYSFKNFKHQINNSYQIDAVIAIHFYEYYYEIESLLLNNNIKIKGKYSSILTEDDYKNILKESAKSIYNEIERINKRNEGLINNNRN